MKHSIICYLSIKVIAARTGGERLPAWVLNHIESCEACRSESETYAKMLSILRSSVDSDACNLTWRATEQLSVHAVANRRLQCISAIITVAAFLVLGLVFSGGWMRHSHSVQACSPRVIAKALCHPKIDSEISTPLPEPVVEHKQLVRHKHSVRIRTHYSRHHRRMFLKKERPVVPEVSPAMAASVSDEEETSGEIEIDVKPNDKTQEDKLSDEAGRLLASGVTEIAKHARDFKYAKVEEKIKDVLDPILKLSIKDI